MSSFSTSSASAAGAQRRGRIEIKPGRFDLLAAAQTLSIGALVNTLEGGVDADDLLAAPRFGGIGHGLGLQGIHARQTADACLVKLDYFFGFTASFVGHQQSLFAFEHQGFKAL